MKIIRCDICNNEMRSYIFDRDSETQYYTLINKYAGRDLETDICNGCMHKLIDFVNAPSVVPSREDCISRKWLFDKAECEFDKLGEDYDINHMLKDIKNAPSVYGERIEE